MSSSPKILTPSLKITKRRTTPTKTRRTRRGPYRNYLRSRAHTNTKSFNGDQYCSKVSDKLQALKNLIPAQNDNGEIKTERLFQETADYILLLRTQVVILQRLIQFHGSTETMEDQQHALL